jgi:hypothetical protein
MGNNTIPKHPVMNFSPSAAVHLFGSHNTFQTKWKTSGRFHPDGSTLKVFHGLLGCILVSIGHNLEIFGVRHKHLLSHLDGSDETSRFQLIVIQSDSTQFIFSHHRFQALAIELAQPGKRKKKLISPSLFTGPAF